jgi:hypothetical protein
MRPCKTVLAAVLGFYTQAGVLDDGKVVKE